MAQFSLERSTLARIASFTAVIHPTPQPQFEPTTSSLLLMQEICRTALFKVAMPASSSEVDLEKIRHKYGDFENHLYRNEQQV
jgi:hypothetical protein